MKIFSPILKGTTTVAQGTTNLSGSFTGSLLGTAATASYADNFTVGGTLTAQTINVQIITSSIEFNTGSTRNGSSTANTHQFTGSVLMSSSLGIGTSSPSSRLDIAWGGYQTQGGAINIGADIGNLTTRTNNTIKYGIISAVPYTNADKPIELLTYYSNNTEKVLSVGGGGNTDFAGLNSISFLTTSSLTQPGAVRMTVTSAGKVGIGTTTPGTYSKLSVAGGISFNNNTDSAVASGEYGNAFSKTSSVTAGGSTVAIKPSLGPESSLMLVSGRSPTGNRFSDLILVIGQGNTAPTVVASRTYLSPSTRTYTNGGESLILQLTGGSEVYTVFVTGIGGTESA